MAKTKDRPLRRGDKVIATTDLPGVPEGTSGRIKLVNGLTWRRYWVFFDNGVDRGSIDDKVLVRAKDWEAFKERRAQAEALGPEGNGAALPQAEPEAEPEAAPAADAGSGDGAEPAAASKVPAHLLERAKKAKEAKERRAQASSS